MERELQLKDIEETSHAAAEYAVSLFKSGFYCSEAIINAVEKYGEVDIPDMVKRGMTSFNEGFGGSGCSCGSLSAVVFISSMFLGRINPEDSTDTADNAARFFHNEFRNKFSSACCRSIKKNSAKFLSFGKYSTCPDIVYFCTEMFMTKALSENWLNG